MIEGLTLHQLQCFDAVVVEGGFQSAAERLGRTQPTVFTAVKNLEAQLGLTLLDRSGYRVALTEAGRSFHDQTRVFLQELRSLQYHARQLAMGEESELRVVIGDLSPVREVLALLRAFFDRHPGTRLHLHVEAIAGPWERLFDGEADLIIHHIDKADPRLEFIDLCAVKLIPVVAPGFLRMPVSEEITPDQMRGYIQCVIRDTARHSVRPNFYIIEGAPSWTVGDQLMKKEIIMQGAAWGHLHDVLIERELRDGRLLSIAGRHLKGGRIELTAARRRDQVHGPIANRLWQHIEERAANFTVAGHE
ncbi:LysR family transcriptional regulator [Labrys miyagiensis]|uniref:LysR family transcriptional regulator n=1 Tax=Labrys miyagiensis TaxID=346912 RepID=A0ABQ6CUW1_9HYPH|nr:LysR family transcriptional regulator [Labrys miyagiensis]